MKKKRFVAIQPGVYSNYDPQALPKKDACRGDFLTAWHLYLLLSLTVFCFSGSNAAPVISLPEGVIPSGLSSEGKVWSNANTSSDRSVFHAGTQSLKISAMSDNYSHWRLSMLMGTAISNAGGKIIKVSFWIRSEGDITISITPFYRKKDEVKKFVRTMTGNPYFFQRCEGSQDWKILSFEVAIPAGEDATDFGWSLSATGGQESSNTKAKHLLWLDDVHLEYVASPFERDTSISVITDGSKVYPPITEPLDTDFENRFIDYSYDEKIGISWYIGLNAGTNPAAYNQDAVGIIRGGNKKEILLKGPAEIIQWHQKAERNLPGQKKIISFENETWRTSSSTDEAIRQLETTHFVYARSNVHNANFRIESTDHQFIKYKVDNNQRISFLVIESFGTDAASAKKMINLNPTMSRADMDKIVQAKKEIAARSPKKLKTPDIPIHAEPVKKPQIVTQQGHFSPITVVRLSPTGKYLITGDKSGNIRVWSTGSGYLIQILKRHSDAITDVCLTPDDAYMFSGSSDRRLIKWNMKTLSAVAIAEYQPEVVARRSPIEAGEIVSSGTTGHFSRPFSIKCIGDKLFSLSTNELIEWNLDLRCLTFSNLVYDNSSQVRLQIDDDTGQLISWNRTASTRISWKPPVRKKAGIPTYHLALDTGGSVSKFKAARFSNIIGPYTINFDNELFDQVKSKMTQNTLNSGWMLFPDAVEAVWTDHEIALFEGKSKKADREIRINESEGLIRDVAMSGDSQSLFVMCTDSTGSTVQRYQRKKNTSPVTYRFEGLSLNRFAISPEKVYAGGISSKGTPAFIALDLLSGRMESMDKDPLEAIQGLSINLNETKLTLLTPNGTVEVDLKDNLWQRRPDSTGFETHYTGQSFNQNWIIRGDRSNGVLLSQTGKKSRFIRLKMPGDSMRVSFAVPSNNGDFIFCAAEPIKPLADPRMVLIFDTTGKWVNPGYSQVYFDNGTLERPVMNRPIYWPALDEDPVQVGPAISPLYHVIMKSREPLQDTLNLSAGYGQVTITGQTKAQGNFIHLLEQNALGSKSSGIVHATDPQNHFWAFASGLHVAAGYAKGNTFLMSENTVFDRGKWDYSGFFVGHGGNVNQIVFSRSSRYLCSTDEDGTILIWTTKDWDRLYQRMHWKVPAAHNGGILQVIFLDDDILVTLGVDNLVRFWNVTERRELLAFGLFRNTKDHFVFSPDGYYYTTKRLATSFAFSWSGKSFPIEQWDLKYNRPEKVYPIWKGIFRDSISTSAIDCKTNWFSCLHERRVTTLYHTNDTLHVSFTEVLPVVKLKTEESRAGMLRLSIGAESLAPLQNLKITVNGSALATPSQWLKNRKNKFEGQIELPLTHGDNEIKVWVTDVNGLMSLKEMVKIAYAGGKSRPNLYLLVAGVNAFADTRLDSLKFAEKDAHDFAAMYLQNKRTFYDSIVVITLLGKDFNRQNLRNAAESLRKAHVDDQIMALVSSHGSKGYIAMHDTPSDQFERGIAIETLDSLISLSHARKRMLAVDACETGEGFPAIAGREPGGKGFKGIVLPAPPRKKDTGACSCNNIPDSFEAVKDFYYDLREKTGTTIIASSWAAMESFESDQGSNGVFTHSIIQVLKSTGKEGQITLFELIDSLPERVEKKAGEIGRFQKPSIRAFNYTNNFQIW